MGHWPQDPWGGRAQSPTPSSAPSLSSRAQLRLVLGKESVCLVSSEHSTLEAQAGSEERKLKKTCYRLNSAQTAPANANYASAPGHRIEARRCPPSNSALTSSLRLLRALSQPSLWPHFPQPRGIGPSVASTPTSAVRLP